MSNCSIPPTHVSRSMSSNSIQPQRKFISKDADTLLSSNASIRFQGVSEKEAKLSFLSPGSSMNERQAEIDVLNDKIGQVTNKIKEKEASKVAPKAVGRAVTVVTKPFHQDAQLLGEQAANWIKILLYGTRNELQEELEKLNVASETKSTLLEQDRELQKRLNTIAKSLQGAEEASALKENDWKTLVQGFESTSPEIQESLKKGLEQLRLLPGGYTGLLNQSKKPLAEEVQRFFNEAVKLLAEQCALVNPSDKIIKGLQKLRRIEAEHNSQLSQSSIIYPLALNHSSSNVQAAALKEVLKEKRIHPVNLEALLTLFFTTNRGELQIEALKGIMENPFESWSVDTLLEDIQKNPTNYKSEPLSQLVEKAIAQRKELGFFHAPQVDTSLEHSGTVDLGLEKIIRQMTTSYKACLLNPARTGPNLKVYLPGNKREETDTFLERLGTQCLGDLSGRIIEYDMTVPENQNPETLYNALKAEDSYEGKILHFKNLEQLDAIQDTNSRDGLINLFKPILGNGEFLADISFKDAILVLTSNQDLENLPVFTTPLGRSLISRLESFTERVEF